MSNCADCGARSCSPSESDTECDDRYNKLRCYGGYNCNYNHGSHWDNFFDYGPDYSFSAWPRYDSYDSLPKYKARPWKVNYSPYYQPTSYDSSRIHDPSKAYGPSQTYHQGDKKVPRNEPVAFLEEHHVVHGNSTHNGPYTHENYRIHNDNGSYHGHYLWDANRPYLGRHIHSGSYGMERNSHQDIYYDDEAEYNLDEPIRRSKDQKDARSGKSRGSKKKSSKKSSKRREKTGSSESTPAKKRGIDDDDWRNEYHYVRGDGVTVYREESRTDGVALARAWMEMDQQMESSTWGRW